MFAGKHREANQIKQWEDQLLDGVSDVFDDKPRASREPEIDVKSPHAKIGQLALGNDFLEGALDKAGLLSRYSADLLCKSPAGQCMARGFVYLVAVLDWFSRKVLAWRLSVTLETAPCLEALNEAIRRFGKPEIMNSPLVTSLRDALSGNGSGIAVHVYRLHQGVEGR